MREKSRVGVSTFALTADVSEAHRQIPVAETKWSREVAAALLVNMASFEEGLGRVMYVVSALEYERPFLAPLYRTTLQKKYRKRATIRVIHF